jgi:hypothetical protein
MRGVAHVVGLIGIALVATGHARADETYALAGELARGGSFKGSVSLRPLEGDEVHVTHVVGATTLVGRGRRTGGLVRAEVQRTAGLVNLGREVTTAGPLSLSFQKNEDGTRWRVRLQDGDALVASGQGELSVMGPKPKTTATATKWVRYEGVPFVKGAGDPIAVHMSDPRQGQLGDCYFIAGLIAVARTNPGRIFSMIESKGGGEYAVTLRGCGSYLLVCKADKTVTVDQSFPADASGLPVYAKLADQRVTKGLVQYELWPMMIERAFAQHRGGYAKMEGGLPATVFELAGGTTTTHDAATMSDEQLRTVLDAALRAGKPVSMAFCRTDLGKAAIPTMVIGHHAYVLTESRDGGYVLYNPWGARHPRRPITPAELRSMGPTIQIGEF